MAKGQGSEATPANMQLAGPQLSGIENESEPPSPQIVHINIGLANTYRLELAKTMLAISAALFAFTVSFPPALTRIDHADILIWAWIGLGGSTIGGLLNLYGWEKFYISYRDYHADYKRGQKHRKLITRGRRVAHFVQMTGMIVGIAALAWFIIVNRSNVKLVETKTVITGTNGSNAPTPEAQGK